MKLDVEKVLKNLDEEKAMIADELESFKTTIQSKVLNLEVSEIEESKKQFEKIKDYLHEVSKNESVHKENVRLNSVNTSRIRSNVKETEDNFSKLLFVQSRNSHDAIANKLHDCTNKVSVLKDFQSRI